MSESMVEAQALMPDYDWSEDDEGNASGVKGAVTITVYELREKFVVLAQIGVFVIGTEQRPSLDEALSALERHINKEMADPDSYASTLRVLAQEVR